MHRKPTGTLTDESDAAEIARLCKLILDRTSRMVHDRRDLTGPEIYVEAVRELVAERKLILPGDHRRTVDKIQAGANFAVEHEQRRTHELREEFDQRRRLIQSDAAAMLTRRASNLQPDKLRDGILLAAAWLKDEAPGHTLPKPAAELVALASRHGWESATAYGEDSGGAPFLNVELLRRDPAYRARLTWHTRDTGTYRLFSLQVRTQNRSWHDGTSLTALRAVITGGRG